jgi:hypothetical protein
VSMGRGRRNADGGARVSRRRSSMFTLLVALLLATGASGQQPTPRGAAARPFPHDRHARLFPSCEGCHAGIYQGDSARFMPPSAVCAQCHNGDDRPVVTWSGYAPTANNLTFTHAGHLAASKAAGAAAQCVSCHAAPADTSWMHVRPATAGACLACHQNREGVHLAQDAACTTCHTSLAQSPALSKSQIAAFPTPAWHTTPGFLSAHAPKTAGAVAQCATCHSRESCQRCHANARAVPAIMQLATDARVKELVHGLAATYPTPASHDVERWRTSHGAAALASASGQGCANCHTQPACKSCHVGGKGTSGRANDVIAALPVPVKDGAPGVQLASVRVHAADFLAHHKTTAASGRLTCTQCHQQRECASCHAGNSSRRYHPLDFSSRHATSAYAQDQTCANCHRTENFCRSCHLQNKVTAKGARTGTAHTGQPLWLLQHGQAARLNLTGCTTCHQQRDCLRCHGNSGLHVNPHGPGFDAAGMSSRNKQMCATCHLTIPGEK